MLIGRPFCMKVAVTSTGPITPMHYYISLEFDKRDFLVAGEIQSEVELMPGEEYTFTYNLVPLKLGQLELPRFSLSRASPSVPPESNKQLFLIYQHSQRVLVVSSLNN